MKQDKNNTYVQIIGPVYWKPIHFISHDFRYTITKAFTEEGSLDEKDLKTWQDVTRNILMNTGSFVEKLVHCLARFITIKVAFSILGYIVPLLRLPLVITEFGYWTAFPLIGNTKNAGHIIDVVNAASSLAYDDTDIVDSLVGIGVGSLTGTPHLTSLMYSWARPDNVGEYVALAVPSYVFSKTGNFNTKLGITNQELLAKLFLTANDMTTAEARVKANNINALNAAALRLEYSELTECFLINDLKNNIQYWGQAAQFIATESSSNSLLASSMIKEFGRGMAEQLPGVSPSNIGHHD